MSRTTTLSPIELAFLCGFAASREGFNGECMVDGLEPDIPDKAKIEDEADYWLKSEGLLQHMDNAKVMAQEGHQPDSPDIAPAWSVVMLGFLKDILTELQIISGTLDSIDNRNR